MLLIEFGSKAAAAINAAKAVYDANLHARRTPSVEACAEAAVAAVAGWNPIVRGRYPLTPVARDTLARAFGILGHNLRACECGGAEYPLI